MKLDVPIETLHLTDNIIKKLKELQLYTVQDLWCCKREFLKKNGCTDSEIHKIQIELQLRSIDFNHKIYKF